MKILQKYFELQKQIYDYFGYEENWKVIPLDDATDHYWMVHKGRYVHSDEPFTLESIEAGDKIYGGSIYTQRFLNQHVYRGPEYTMVCADTQADDNKLLMVFDNSKECTDPKLKEAYDLNW